MSLINNDILFANICTFVTESSSSSTTTTTTSSVEFCTWLHRYSCSYSRLALYSITALRRSMRSDTLVQPYFKKALVSESVASRRVTGDRRVWHLLLQWVYCTTWPAVARAGEAHVTFTAFPLSFPCDAHIPHLASLVRQSDLCSRPVHTWIKLRRV